MGVVVSGSDVCILRHFRQKNFYFIEPLYEQQSGGIDRQYAQNYWYSTGADLAQGNQIQGNHFQYMRTPTNVQIPPLTSLFNVTNFTDTYYLGPHVYAYSDPSIVDEIGAQDKTIYAGCGLNWSSIYANEFPQTKSRPWEKVGLSWVFYSSLKTYRVPVYNNEHQSPILVSNATNTISNTLFPTSLEPSYISNGLSIPPETARTEPVLGDNGEILYLRAIEYNYYLGSVSVGNVSVYRRGPYHHA